MKIRLCLIICCLGMLTGCASYYGGNDCCSGCGGCRTYDSQCGRPSCTDNCGLSGYAESYPTSCL